LEASGTTHVSEAELVEKKIEVEVPVEPATPAPTTTTPLGKNV